MILQCERDERKQDDNVKKITKKGIRFSHYTSPEQKYVFDLLILSGYKEMMCQWSVERFSFTFISREPLWYIWVHAF